MIKEKMIDILYDFWCKTDDCRGVLYQEIESNIDEGINGLEVFFDWCRCDYDGIREMYGKKHNLTEEEVDNLLNDNLGIYDFMYEDIPYAHELDNIWNLCNYYYDYLKGDMKEENLLRFMEGM